MDSHIRDHHEAAARRGVLVYRDDGHYVTIAIKAAEGTTEISLDPYEAIRLLEQLSGLIAPLAA